MLAHLLHQTSQLCAEFSAQIGGKTAIAHDDLAQRFEDRLAGAPQALRLVVQWGARLAWDHQARQQVRYGRQGGQQLTVALRWRLSRDWWLLPNVLLSPDRGT